MKTLVKAIIVANKWKPHRKYRGLRGYFRRLRRGKLEKAHGMKISFGDKEITIDFSFIQPNMMAALYGLLPPIPCDSKDGFRIEVIPPDADLYPYEIEIISGDDTRTNIGEV